MTFRLKLIVFTILTVSIAQAIGGAVSAYMEMGRTAQTRQQMILQTATVIAANAATPLSTGDTRPVESVLAGVVRSGTVPHAAVFFADGRLAAESGGTEQLSDTPVIRPGDRLLPPMSLLGARAIRAEVPVVKAGTVVGLAVVDGDVSDLPRQLGAAVLVSLAVTLLVLAVALVLAVRLQVRLLRPLMDLSRTMGAIAEQHTYDLPPVPAGKDEVGVLATSFNRMMVEIRERDQKLVRHRKRLETDVAERTADYRRATAEAEAANKAKSDFLATMSHEIRTPMNGLLVMAELLARSELPPRARRQAEVIARSGESLLAIINDILDFSKIEAGKLTLETMPVDVAAAVDQTLRVFGDRARTKGLDLASAIRLTPGTLVVADPVRLGQVLGNLVGNAIKFTEKGAVTVAVVRRDDMVRIEVRDTGIGIPADRIPAMFEAFEQADRSTTRRFGGTGLGLSIARKLVEAMGGEIAVESRPGEGSCFSFTLKLEAAGSEPALATGHGRIAVVALSGPATAASASETLREAGYQIVEGPGADTGPAALVLTDGGRLPDWCARHLGPETVVAACVPLAETAGSADLAWPLSRDELRALADQVASGRRPTASDLSTAPREPKRFTGLRVLVADDVEVNREVARSALAELGAAAVCVENGRLAVEATERETFDLVLMDGSMPELDGFEATRVIRDREARDGRPRLPIVAVTAHVVGAAADEWRHSGMDGVLRKPFKMSDLEAVLARHAPAATTSPPASSESVQVEAATATAVEEAAQDALFFDPQPLADLRARPGGDLVAARVIAMFARTTDEILDRLQTAATSQDAEAIGASAHALKSMCLNIGAAELARLCSAVEREARSAGAAPSETLLGSLRDTALRSKEIVLASAA